METLSRFYSYFLNRDLTIPAIQMVYFLGLINILMLLRRYRIIYLVGLIFSLYWLVVLNQDKLGTLASDVTSGSWMMLGGGLVVLIVALFCFLVQSDNM